MEPCKHTHGLTPMQFWGKPFCPFCAKKQSMNIVQKKLENKDFVSSSPAPFVGRYGYPFVNIGIMAPPELKENVWLYDAPRYWASHSYSIPQIMDFRSELINSHKKTHIKDQEKILDIAQDIAMSSRPVDVEISLKDKPKFSLNTDSTMAPQGPNAQLLKAELTSTPKIHTKVERAFSDTDLRASEALTSLYENNFDETALMRMLSVGAFGLKSNRKLVPTRWSITATDDTLGKHLIGEIKQYPESDYRAYFGSHLGNYYLILCFPDLWSYELFETMVPLRPTSDIHASTDYEGFNGRKDYAEGTAGGYYTVRLAIAEHLKSIKRQASVLALRFITGEYAAPLGVWVTREATRKAMSNKPIEFGSKELMLNYAKLMAKRKFNLDIEGMLNKSLLLKNVGRQKRLSAY